MMLDRLIPADTFLTVDAASAATDSVVGVAVLAAETAELVV